MKYYVLYILLFYSYSVWGQVVIPNDEAKIDNSAELKIYTSVTSSKGVLIPQLTSLQMLKINSPADGLMIFNSSDKTFEFYNLDSLSWDRIGRISTYTTALSPPLVKFNGECYFNINTKTLFYWNAKTSSWVQIPTL